MKYLPQIIPAEHKILPDYFQEKAKQSKVERSKENGTRYIIAIPLLLCFFVFITHFGAAVLFGLAGLIILPGFKRWIEKVLVFRLTFRMSAVLVSLLLVSASLINNVYIKRDEVQAETERQIALKKRLQDEARERQLKIRRDSIQVLLNADGKLVDSKKYDLAIDHLNLILKDAANSEEQLIIKASLRNAERKKAINLVSRSKYQAAYILLNTLIANGSDPILLYNRAICHNRQGDKRSAITDLREAMQAGHHESARLYEKLNPLKRRIIYYVTRCCDGSTSNAKGRGACSHHGGVCDWNEPVYETYRDY